MKLLPAIVFALSFLIFAGCATAQPWRGLLTAGIDWSKAGVGEIPARPTNCAVLHPPASTAQINAALASCAAGQAVFLAPGVYSVTGSIHVPAHVTLRGAGADATILNAVGGGDAVIDLGTGDVVYDPHMIVSGAAAGETKIVLGSVERIGVGGYLAIAEANDPSFVTSAGSGGNCNWCDGGWSKTGSLARGQIVAVTAIEGKTVTISPGLYGSYAHGPVAVPFRMSADHAGVENLQVKANRTGYSANFKLSACAYCWIKGVESNYADGDHVAVMWGYRDEIRDSYFSNAFDHLPGAHDADVQLALKTSATLVENNIFERLHASVMLEWGAAGNVIGYNYTTGEFDSGSPNVVIGGVDFHGAHPQFNLIEGNVLTAIYADSVWGSSSHTTAYRNWIVGTNRNCHPLEGRATVICTAARAPYGFEAARAVQVSYLATHSNFIGNVVGSAQMQALMGYNRPVPQIASLEYPAFRGYAVAVGWTFGYGSANDDGSGSGCGGGNPPCHRAGIAAANFLHGNYNNITKSVAWAPGVAHTLSPSFYLAGKPVWWGRLPYPAIGPDVTGGGGPGGHSYGNPAQTCFAKVMGGSDGGAGSPLTFNAERCYGRISPFQR